MTYIIYRETNVRFVVLKRLPSADNAPVYAQVQSFTTEEEATKFTETENEKEKTDAK